MNSEPVTVPRHNKTLHEATDRSIWREILLRPTMVMALVAAHTLVGVTSWCLPHTGERHPLAVMGLFVGLGLMFLLGTGFGQFMQNEVDKRGNYYTKHLRSIEEAGTKMQSTAEEPAACEKICDECDISSACKCIKRANHRGHCACSSHANIHMVG
jgi:hypothetical protein